MCNIAAYVGAREAAPLMIEMMRKEEGFSGGYYTGLATLSKGKVFMEKKTGDLQYLLDHTPAATLPGTCGIIHSRSKSGGGDEWAHPFLDGFHEEPELAYVANGYAGCCEKLKDKAVTLVEDLLRDGCRMPSRIKGEPDAYTALPDGTNIHMSDVVCQVISRFICKGLSPEKAMDRAFCEAPSEVVGLMIHKDFPDRIFFARYNFPMFAGFADHGAYLSSTPLAFPEDVKKIIPIPSSSFGFVTAEALTVLPLSKPAFTVAEEDVRVSKEAYESVATALGEGKKTFSEIARPVKALFSGADSTPYYQVTHQILFSLQKEGKLTQTTEWRPGVFEGLKAPQLMLEVKK